MVERTKLEQLSDEDVISSMRLATALETEEGEIAEMLGLSLESVSSYERLQSPMTQSRLRELLEILIRVEPHMGSSKAALSWYRTEPLPSFGGITAVQLVKEGRANSVCRYLDRMNAGGYS